MPDIQQCRDFSEMCGRDVNDIKEANRRLKTASALLKRFIDDRQSTLIIKTAEATAENAQLIGENGRHIGELREQVSALTEQVGKLTEQVAAMTAAKTVPKKDKPAEKKKFVPPTIEEVSGYCKERGGKVDPQHWYDYYSARGWVLSNGKKMADWKAAVRTWEKNGFAAPPVSSKGETADDDKHSYNLGLLAEHALTHVPTGIGGDGKPIYG